MPTAHEGEGLYVGFLIKQEKPLTQFVKRMPGAMGTPLDFEHLEMPGMVPSELGDLTLNRETRRSILPMTRQIQRRLGAITIIGTTVDTSYGELVLSSRARQPHAVITVNPSAELLEAREAIADVVKDELGIKVPSSNPSGWEIAVARRRDSKRKLPEYKRRMPETLTVAGVVVTLRASGTELDRFKPRYTRGTRR